MFDRTSLRKRPSPVLIGIVVLMARPVAASPQATVAPDTVEATSPAAPDRSGTYRLRLSDRVGSLNRYRLSFDMDIRAEYSDGDIPNGRARRLMQSLGPGIQMHTVMEYEQELTNVEPDDTRVFEIRWDDYRFSGKVGGDDVTPPPQADEAVDRILSQTALVRTTARGQTVDVKYDAPAFARAGEELRAVQNALPTLLPDGPVQVGDRWTGETELPLRLPTGESGTVKVEMRHTLREIRPGPAGPVAVIDLQGSYSDLEGARAGAILPMYLEATLTGTARFDIEAGRFGGGEYEVDMFALNTGEEGGELRLTGHASGELKLLDSR